MSRADAAMERYAMGDDEAFAEVYAELAPHLLPFLRRYTSSAARAEDLLEQTFLEIHRGRGSFAPGAEVTPWALAIARRLGRESARNPTSGASQTPPRGER